jgi:hypothetical protein
MAPAVTIVTPARNRVRSLCETLDSVGCQTFDDWEHFVVDDGSEDGTAGEVQRRAVADPRIRYMARTGNKSGANPCRNLGWQSGAGEFVIFLDSDDLLSPHCLQQRVDIMRRNPHLDFAIFDGDVFREQIGDLGRRFDMGVAGDDLDRFLALDIPWETTSPIWRKEMLVALGGWDDELMSWQDVDLHIRALATVPRYVRFRDVDHHVRWVVSEERISRRKAFEIGLIENCRPCAQRWRQALIRTENLSPQRNRALAGVLFHLSEQLAGLGIDRAALIAALQAQNAVTPAGVVQTGDEKILVRVSGAFRSEQDILAVNFVANHRIIRLGDIAHVTRGPADPAQPMFRVNGREGIGLAIAMRKGGDVLALGRNVAQAMTEITENLPVGIEPTLVADQPVTVEHAVDDFMEALWEAVAIVLAVSLVSLGLRAGAVVALSIPLVLAAVFVAMELFGIDLQRISLGALIIALGLLVDDAMITVETMVTRLEHGDDKEKSATFAYTSTAFPMLTGTLVTVAGFVPIGFARSAAGEYTFSIFAVVAIALIVSWFVAVLFAPLLGVWVLKKPKTVHSGEPGWIMRSFRHFLVLAMRARWVTVLVTLGLFAAALYGMRFVPQQFFPSSDRPELLVELQLPENASIYSTKDVAARLDKLLQGDPDVDHWSTNVGQGAVRFYLPLNVQLPNDFFAQAVVVTKGIQQRERVKARLAQALAHAFPTVAERG